jgi:MFS family permease
MPGFFPRHSIAWKVEEPPAFRALTLSVVEIGLLTGVIYRLVRALLLAHVPGGHLLYLGGIYVALGLLLCGAAAAHLGNYPISTWLWRVPLFAILEVCGEMITSIVLVATHRERLGTLPADWDDVPSMALQALVFRTLVLCTFALILAGVVQVVRAALLRHQDRGSTVAAIREGRTGE